MTTTTRKTTTQTTSCPKCSGTGTVSRFLDYKGGVCFDCGGKGTLTLTGTARGKKAPRIALTVELAHAGVVVRADGRDGTTQTITTVEPMGAGMVLVTTDTGAQFWLTEGRAGNVDFLEVI